LRLMVNNASVRSIIKLLGFRELDSEL